MKNKGFFNLPREIEDLDIFRNPRRTNHLRVFLALASQARFNAGTVKDRVTGRDWPLKKGELMFGRNAMADRLNIPASTIRNIIDALCDDGLIRKEHVEFKYFTIISVAYLTFDKKDYRMCYNDKERLKPVDNKKDITKDITTATNNNDKECKTNIDIESLANEILNHWNTEFGTKLKGTSFSNNLKYWLDTYSMDDLKQAITNLSKAPKTFWMVSRKNGQNPTPTLLLRTKSKNLDEKVDYIEQCLLLGGQATPKLTKERYDYLKSKNSLTNNEADEFADLSLKFEGGQQ